MKQPNSVCKNRDCTKGVDGTRARFYACAYCVRSLVWRSVACCPECFEAYLQQVNKARSQNKPVDLLPERTDMSREEVAELMGKPLKEVIIETHEELADYAGDLETVGFSGVVDKINEEIRARQADEKKSRRKIKAEEQG